LITLIKDIDLITDVEKYDVILVGTNVYHTMGNGFQKKIRLKYPQSYSLNLETKYGDKSKIGTRATTVTGIPKFSLCFITNGYNFRPDLTPDYLDYDGLMNCIKTANIEFSGLNVATTMIGGSKFDGNGNIDKIMHILKNNSDRMNLFIYDYEQIPRNVEKVIEYLKIAKNESYDKKKKMEIFNNIPDENSPMDNNEKRFRRIRKEINDLLNKK
jgi:hypothetical protein